jgi:hypothetical protein
VTVVIPLNVPKWVQEFFKENDNEYYLKEDIRNNVPLDDIWARTVLDAPDYDIACFNDSDFEDLVRTFYHRATKEDWAEMKEKFSDEYQKPRHVAYEQVSIYYYELFGRELKKLGLGIAYY